MRVHPEYGEKWVQKLIADDPSILGLGDLVLRDQDRIHPRAGRLDLLLQDPDTQRRYEVELQLGATDEAHIIRTIEYWDIERKRYPQYDHCAVLVAEDITSRFLGVIGLFNGMIPIIAIQLQALKVGDQVALVFTKVLDERELGLEEPDEPVKPSRTRADWEAQAPKNILQIVDFLFEAVKALDSAYELNYKKKNIGLAKSGIADQFVRFRPMQRFLKVCFRLDQSEELEKQI